VLETAKIKILKEEFLHYLWKHQLLIPAELHTTEGEALRIVYPGVENSDSGPDFLAAKIMIGDTLWVGQVELHLKSSLWSQHGHQNDAAYGNVILHVVYIHDQDVLDCNGNTIPVLELHGKFREELLHNYQLLLSSKAWIPCQGLLNKCDKGLIAMWLNRLLVERLERKSEEVEKFFEYFKNDWDQTLYYLLARNFGFKANAIPFALLAQRTPLKILQKLGDNAFAMEAILYGQSDLLPKECADNYPQRLQNEYAYQRKKHSLEPLDAHLWKFFKLRPQNFPTIRISQFAKLITQTPHLFRMLTDAKSIEEIAQIFKLNASEYWGTHYVFGKASAFSIKKLGADAVNNIIINTISPVIFVYGKQSLRPEYCEKAIDFLAMVPAENNMVIRQWAQLGITAQNAGESQALLELKKYYCTPKSCLQCAIGSALLQNKRGI